MEHDTITDSLFTISRTFTYDDLNRMITGNGTFGANQSQTNCTYTYNAIGNLTNKCGAPFTYGNSMHPSAVTFNPATNKNYTYDNNGNMTGRGTQTLVWDIENRVTGVSISGGGSAQMQYDFTGMRVKKDSTTTGVTLYPFKGYEIDSSGTISKFIRIGNESFASSKRTSGGTITQYFYHNDHLGSVNVITNIGGNRVQRNEYEPWGEVSRSEGATPGSPATVDLNHRFTGQELDPETGLHYYGGRYYDQEIGRFASPDPYVQAPENPQNLNRYTYVLNNPQYYVDPTGHFFGLDDLLVVTILTTAALMAPEVTIPTITMTTLMQLGATLNVFTSSIYMAQRFGSNTELDKLSQQRASNQNAHSRNAQPQGDSRLSKDYPSGDIPGQGQEPWWKLRNCINCFQFYNPGGKSSPNPKLKKHDIGGFTFECETTVGAGCGVQKTRNDSPDLRIEFIKVDLMCNYCFENGRISDDKRGCNTFGGTCDVTGRFSPRTPTSDKNGKVNESISEILQRAVDNFFRRGTSTAKDE